MARIGKSDVHAALRHTADLIKEAGGADKRISRADIKSKLNKLDGTQKDLADILFRFIDHRDHKPGATVTHKDVDRALEYAKKELIDDYDLNNNGLSKAEISKMSTSGQLAVQLAKELKAAGGAGLDPAAIAKKATAFVVDNASADPYAYRPEAGKLFPGIDSGEENLKAFMVTGEQAAKLYAFAKLWHGNAFEGPAFDPAKHDVVAVRSSFDEEGLYLNVIDRQTGETTALGHAWAYQGEDRFSCDIELVDMTYDVTQDKFEEIFGPLSAWTSEEFEYLDHYAVLDYFLEGQKELDLPHGD